jgi:hypothetical protein
MIRADSLRGWVRVVALCLSLATQAAATEPLTVTFVSPGAGATVSPEVSVAIRIAEDGRPFTKAGVRRWAQATIWNQRGQVVAQLPLRDNGQGSDQVRGDGEFECFGEPAKEAAAADPKHVVWGLKRLLGLTYRDACDRGELARFHYEHMDASGKLQVKIGSSTRRLTWSRCFFGRSRRASSHQVPTSPSVAHWRN